MLNKLVSLVDAVVERLNKIFPPVLVQFFIYAGIGVLGAVLDLSSFALLNKYFSMLYIISFLIGKTIGVINNFALNAVFNFKTSDKLLNRFFKFYGVALVGMGVGSVAMYVAVQILKLDTLCSNIVITFVVAVLQFGVNRVFSFKRS